MPAGLVRMVVVDLAAGQEWIVSLTHSGAQHFATVLEGLGAARPGLRVLAVGCGKGHEVSFLSDRLAAQVVGIEPRLNEKVREVERDGLRFVEASVLAMPFDDHSFDAVFYHHVIEHVGDAQASLSEIARVLRPAGWLYVGTPNRHRLVGYAGSFDASLRQKVRWNVSDYRARMRGRFRNELGAHAGFSHRELARMLSREFVDLRMLTADYLSFKYRQRLPAVALAALRRRIVLEVAAPSIYAVCRRESSCPPPSRRD